MTVVKSLTKPCIVCDQKSVIELTEQEDAALKAGRLVQYALPDRDEDFRELVISGTHPECFDSIFQNDFVEDEDEDY